MNRRDFIKNAISWFAVALGGWGSAGLAASPTPKPSPPGPRALPQLGETFGYDNFKAHVGETFYVYGGKGLRNVVNLKLVAVDGLRRDKNAEQFAVRFSGPVEEPLSGGVYHFQHSASGEFDLLIAPAMFDGKSRYYRADFNLLLP